MTHPNDALRLVPASVLKAFETIAKVDVKLADGDTTIVNISRIRDLVNAAAPASPLPEGGGWQDISTAPKDGSEFQAWWKGTWQPRARFDPEYGSFQLWGRTDFDTEGWEPFEIDGFWQPQPAVPTGAK